MKKWEDMKDFSFVGIKLTKAHSLTQGLKRCQVQKLTRNNPVYQHLKLHQKYKKMKNCFICLRSQFSPIRKTPPSHSMTQPFIKTYYSQNKYNYKEKRSKQQKQQVGQVYSKSDLNKKQVQTFVNKIQELTDGLRTTKSAYMKLDRQRSRLQQKFYIDQKGLQIGIQQDLGIYLEQLRKNKSLFRSSFERKKLKMKKEGQKVKQLNKRVVFPFSQRQMQSIVLQDNKLKQNIEVKSNKIIRSLYDYKSSANYSNRMNTVKNFIQK